MSGPGYGCAADDCTNPVNWLLTHMRPAGTLSVCDEHAPVFMIGMLAEVLGVEVGPLYDVIRKHVDRQAAKAAKAAADAYEAAQAAGDAGDGSERGAEGPYTGPVPDDEAEETGIFHGFGEEAL